jgi:hypothetical protein
MRHLPFVIDLAALTLMLGAAAIVMHARLSIRPGVGSVLGGIPGTLRPRSPPLVSGSSRRRCWPANRGRS